MSLTNIGGDDPRRNKMLPKRSMSGLVADHIRELVFDGTLTRGQRVPQDEISQTLGVSRLPVREALITLESEGVVRSVPHKGTYVVPIEKRDIEEHYRIYGMIQGLAAENAATRLREDQLKELELLHQQMQDPQELHRFHELDWAFHASINRIGGSSRLRFVLRHLGQSLPISIYRTPVGPVSEAIIGHQQILEGLRTGDSNLAGTASVAHTVHEGAHVVVRLRLRGVLVDESDESPLDPSP